MAPDASRRSGGFTLLEVLVAFAILSVSLVAITRAFSTGLVIAERVDARTQALMHARGLLERAGPEIPLVPGVATGDLGDGFSWSVEVTPSDLVPAAAEARLFRVRAEVAWEGGTLDLATMKLGRP